MVVPTDPEPTVNMELLPESKEAMVDLPTPRPPTIDTMVSCFSNSQPISARLLILSLAASVNTPERNHVQSPHMKMFSVQVTTHTFNFVGLVRTAEVDFP